MGRLAFAIALLSAAAVSADPGVVFRADRSTVQAGVPFQLMLEISGSKIGQPAFSEVDGLEIQGRPVNSFTSTQVEFGSGGMKTVKRLMLTYLARANKPGKLTIPGISIEVDGKTVKSDPVIVSVIAGGVATPPQASPPSPVPASTSQPDAPAPERSQPTGKPSTEARPLSQATWQDVAYAEMSVDKREVYEGETLLLTLSVAKLSLPGLHVQSVAGKDRGLPTTEGFYTVPLRQDQQTQAQRNGFSYDVTQKRIALCPTVNGDLKIGAWHWEGLGVHNFQEQMLRCDAPAIDIKVKPLPERPSGFSGAVGAFRLEAQLERTSAVQGTPVRLLVKVTGQGNPDAIGAPILPKIENAYVGDPEKDTKTVETGSGLTVVKTFAYPVTPMAPGELTIPELAFCYFDPASAQFKTEKTQPFRLAVTPSQETASRMVAGERLPAQQKRLSVIGEDIHPPITQVSGLAPVRPLPALPYVVSIVPPLAYALLVAFARRRHRYATDQVFARAHGAKGKARRRLSAATQSNEPSEDVYKAIVGFIADTLNVPEGGITSSDVTQLFADRSLDANLARDVSTFLRECERVRYGSERVSRDAATLAREASGLVDRIETANKERRR